MSGREGDRASPGQLLPFGRDTLQLGNWPYRLDLLPGIPAPAPPGALAVPEEIAEQVAGHLVRVAGDGRVAVAVPDRTRPAWSRAPVPPLVRELARRGLSPSRIDLIVARGLHEGGLPADLEGLDVSVHLHDPYAPDLAALGEISSVPVRLHPRWVGTKARVSLGTAGFHYLAGFGGGRKTVVPGLAGAETIAAVHRAALGPNGRREAGLGPGRLEGNPVHHRLEEAAGLAPPALVIEGLATGDGPRWLVGHWQETHRQGAAWIARSRSLAVAETRSLVVASAGGHPRDRDLIQSHKALEHLRAALRPGGTAVLVAACGDGPGHPDLLDHCRLGDARAIAAALSRRFAVYGQTAWALKEKTERYHLILVSRLDPASVSVTGLTPARDLDEALAQVRRRLPETEPGWLLPDAGVYLALTDR